MRQSFRSLVESIREYFISIDDRMEKLVNIVQAKFEESDM